MSEAGVRRARRRRGLFAFVVQKHRATALHYDFRLEVGGVMPSWAIPKGPTLDPGVKRLAMPTEDHDMEYRNFEGVIGAGEYGAGPVMIWDEGTFSPEVEVARGARREITEPREGEEALRAGLREGNLKFTLYGKKLKGSFSLVRTEMGGRGNMWLMIKHRDADCKSGYDAADYDVSARTGRSLAKILEDAQ